MEALPAKVDGVAAYILMLKSKRAAVRAEIDRLKALEAAAAARIDRINRYVADILERQPMPKKGPRKLAGATSELRLVGNGGLQPLDITDESLVPEEFRDVVMTITAEQYYLIGKEFPDMAHTRVSSLSNSRIREALAENCSDCEGDGTLHHSAGTDAETCPTCGGSGKRGVPGAHLNPRGSHIEVK